VKGNNLFLISTHESFFFFSLLLFNVVLKQNLYTVVSSRESSGPISGTQGSQAVTCVTSNRGSQSKIYYI
jgi:hypothetical protein